jgi:hypothetical protein
MKQYRVVDKATNETFGWLVGKVPKLPTGNPGLVVDRGGYRVIIEITPKTEAKYRVDVMEVTNE